MNDPLDRLLETRVNAMRLGDGARLHVLQSRRAAAGGFDVDMADPADAEDAEFRRA